MRKLDFSTALKKTLKYNHFHYLLYRETDSISAEVLDVFVFDEGLRMLQGSFSAGPCPALSSGLGSEHHMPPPPHRLLHLPSHLPQLCLQIGRAHV